MKHANGGAGITLCDKPITGSMSVDYSPNKIWVNCPECLKLLIVGVLQFPQFLRPLTSRKRAYWLIEKLYEGKRLFNPLTLQKQLLLMAHYYQQYFDLVIDTSRSKRFDSDAIVTCVHQRGKARCHRCSRYRRSPKLCLHPKGPNLRNLFLQRLERRDSGYTFA